MQIIDVQDTIFLVQTLTPRSLKKAAIQGDALNASIKNGDGV